VCQDARVTETTGLNYAVSRWNPTTTFLVFAACGVAAVVFAACGIAQLIGIVNAHNNFARVRAPGAAEVILPRGRAYVWLETSPKYPVQPGTMEIRVTSTVTAQDLPISAPAHPKRYNTFGRDGRTVGEITVPSEGTYLLSARGGGGNSVSVGRIADGFLAGWAIAWFALAAIAFAAWIVLGAFVVRERRRHRSDDNDLVTA